MKSRAGQIGHCTANGSPMLRRFFGAVLPGRKVVEMGSAIRYMPRRNNTRMMRIWFFIPNLPFPVNFLLSCFTQSYLDSCSIFFPCRNLRNTMCSPLPPVASSGRYQSYCKCLPGYQPRRSSQGTFYCRDVDECEILSPCSQFCTNLYGSFKCSCDRGWVLFVSSRYIFEQ